MRRFYTLTFLMLISLSLGVLSACTPATSEPFVVADLFATPGKALATAELSPTPPPTATSPNMPTNTTVPTLPLPTSNFLQPTSPIETFGPLPTRTLPPGVTGTPPPVNPSACAIIPSMPFTPIWQNLAVVQSLVRCPTGDPFEVVGVWQFYEHGFMFWRESDHSIFVLSELKINQGQPSDTWWRVADTWQEGEPETDPALVPPEGLRQPARGFGEAWRGNGFIREAMGWATSEELFTNLLWQNFDGGWMITSPDGISIYVMAPSDASQTSGVHLGSLP